MPHYYFHIRDGHHLHRDWEGQDLLDLLSALTHILRVRHELASDPEAAGGLVFEVTDASGSTLLRVPVQPSQGHAAHQSVRL